jgi:hypothetical protein
VSVVIELGDRRTVASVEGFFVVRHLVGDIVLRVLCLFFSSNGQPMIKEARP